MGCGELFVGIGKGVIWRFVWWGFVWLGLKMMVVDEDWIMVNTEEDGGVSE